MNESKMKIFRMVLGYEKDEEGNDITEKPIKAPLPVYSTPGAACFDIYSANTEPMIIEPGRVAMIPTGIKAEIQSGYQLLLFNRSGIATKGEVMLTTGTSVIDEDYRGEIKIPMFNHGRSCFVVEPFMRICQGQVLPKYSVNIEEVDDESELSDTDRADGGFSSTGVN